VRKRGCRAGAGGAYVVIVAGNHLAERDLLAGAIPRLVVVDRHVAVEKFA